MDAIKSAMSVKIPRRSSRLHRKDTLQKGRSCLESLLSAYSLGYFDLLPVELRFNVLSFLGIDELSMMTICSKAMRNLVEVYRVTRCGGPHCLSHIDVHGHLSVEQQSEALNKYHKFGLLMKRSTCLYATKDRLKIINDFLTRISCCNTKSCLDQSDCVALLCFGKFLHTIIAGWDDTECLRTFDAICQHTFMHKQIERVMTSKPGTHANMEVLVRYFVRRVSLNLYNTVNNSAFCSHSDMEVSVRYFFRRVFLDLCNTVNDRAFWLSRILKPWPIVFQARLLFILYSGNFSSGKLQWQEMSESTPADIHHSVQFYSYLSSALQVLHQRESEWCSDDIVCIIDEMTSLPEEWLVENVAGLLLSCGDSIATKILVSKVINGRYAEITAIIASLCLVCVKYNHRLSVVVPMMESILKVIDDAKDRYMFLCQISNAFRELIIDTHEFAESEDANETEFYYYLTAFTEFSKEMSTLAFKEVIGM